MIALELTFMSTSTMLFIAGGGPLVRLFTSEPAVVGIGVRLIQVAAAFQLFAGVQVVTTEALRGLGDTRTPMLTNLVGHWFVALPVAAFCGFTLGYGVIDLWAGLCVGLVLVGLFLLSVWRRHIHDRAARPHRPRAPGARRGAPVTPDRLFTPRFFLMCSFTVTVFLSVFQLIPVSPFHVRDLGGGPRASGLFLGFLTFASAWSAPFTGALADHVGRRRTLVGASLGLAGFSASYA